MNILLIGANGQVSRELQLRLAGQGQVIVRGSQQLDLARPEQIRQQVRELRPDLIVNAAAYTAVDQAESERDLAFAINATGPGILAEEAAALGAPLIHYSTDYVFDGSKETAYTEADTPTPLGVYGQSKWAGEQAIQAVGGAHLILRTSWVYSLHGHNFLLTMQRLLQERESLNVVVDQVGAPTWAGSIAQTTEQIIQHWRNDQGGPWGTYHLAAQGEISWFGFASAIAEQLRLQGKP
ncbi:MAG TPA: dTDP-4-dehydrorhamnose reductase, partial [Pseudomonas sp.]|nr:dTDP-4-dehydrorhamnose reductase [Pseudomonas sp.]